MVQNQFSSLTLKSTTDYILKRKQFGKLDHCNSANTCMEYLTELAFKIALKSEFIPRRLFI